MADDLRSIILVLVEEVISTAERNLVDILLDFVRSHAYATVAHSDSLGFFVEFHPYLEFAHIALKLALAGQCLELLGSIDSIAHNLTQEDFMVTVEKFLDNGENVFSSYPNVSLFHIFCCLVILLFSCLVGCFAVQTTKPPNNAIKW